MDEREDEQDRSGDYRQPAEDAGERRPPTASGEGDGDDTEGSEEDLGRQDHGPMSIAAIGHWAPTTRH